MRDKLYVSCGERNVVAVFDCTQDSLICEIPVGNYPLKMYLNGQHRKLYVHNDDDCNLMVIDLWTNTVVDTLDIGTNDRAGCYSASADKFYSSSSTGVVVIDGVADTVLAEFALPNEGYATAISEHADLGLVLVGSSPGSYVTTLDSHGDSIIGSIRCPLGLDEFQWLPASRHFLAVCRGSDVLAVLTETAAVVETVLVSADSPFSATYSSRSERAYVGHLGSPKVYVVRDSAVGIEEPLASPQTVACAVRVRPSVFAHAVTVEHPTQGPVDVFASDGRKVAELQPAGQAPVVWDGCCQDGAEAPPGIYVFVPRSKPGLAVKGVKTMK